MWTIIRVSKIDTKCVFIIIMNIILKFGSVITQKAARFRRLAIYKLKDSHLLFAFWNILLSILYKITSNPCFTVTLAQQLPL